MENTEAMESWPIVMKCGEQLAARGYSIAFAESATAGSLSAAFSLSPHSGKILKGGIVCYDACLKEDLLGIPNEIIEKYTPESAIVTREMASRLALKIKADVYVAVTGLTTSGGSETEEKPVGTIFTCIIIRDQMHEDRTVFKGSQQEVVRAAVAHVATLIIQYLRE